MLSYLQLQYSSRTEVTREARSDDRWDRDDTTTDWYIQGIKLIPQDSSDTVCVPWSVKPGDRVYPVWAIWSTGDSFGHDEASHMELIDVFLDEAKAKAAIAALEGGDKDKFTATYVREDGAKIKFHRPWAGYFEHLNQLTYQPMMVLSDDE